MVKTRSFVWRAEHDAGKGMMYFGVLFVLASQLMARFGQGWFGAALRLGRWLVLSGRCEVKSGVGSMLGHLSWARKAVGVAFDALALPAATPGWFSGCAGIGFAHAGGAGSLRWSSNSKLGWPAKLLASGAIKFEARAARRAGCFGRRSPHNWSFNGTASGRPLTQR